MGTQFQFEVIIPVKDRSEIIQCVQSLQLVELITKILICDGGSTEINCMKSLQKLENQDQVEILQFPSVGFNKSKLINQGIYHSQAEFLLISDADIIWNQATLDGMLKLVSANNNTLCYVKTVEETHPNTVALKRDAYTYKIRDCQDTAFIDIIQAPKYQSHSRPGCGLICAKRTTLLALGGYKEIFTGWGWEDQDLLMRAFLLEMRLSAIGKVVHISHSDEVRNKHNGNLAPSQSRNFNIISCLESLSQGMLTGDLPIKIKKTTRYQQIFIQLPSTLISNESTI
ncbi:MAG: glycosyltransferase [Calothrix sp. C42_A2020_038]|nr:glycosyltransferase [Calothrix sp. C42_A2020_038]